MNTKIENPYLKKLNDSIEKIENDILNEINCNPINLSEKNFDKLFIAILKAYKEKYLPLNHTVDDLVRMKENVPRILNYSLYNLNGDVNYDLIINKVLSTVLTNQIQQEDLNALETYHDYLKEHPKLNEPPLVTVRLAGTYEHLNKAIQNNTPISQEIEKNLILNSKSVNILNDTNCWLTDYNSYLNTTLGCRYHAEKKAIIEQFQTILSDKKDNNLIKLHKLSEALTDPETARILQTDSIGAAFSEIVFRIKHFFNPNSEIPKHMVLKTQLQKLKQGHVLLSETTKENTNNKESDQDRSSFDVF